MIWILECCVEFLKYFRKLKLNFGKHYEKLEDEISAMVAMGAFLKIKLENDIHNERFEKGEITFKRKICEFSDLKLDEFNKYFNGFKF